MPNRATVHDAEIKGPTVPGSKADRLGAGPGRRRALGRGGHGGTQNPYCYVYDPIVVISRTIIGNKLSTLDSDAPHVPHGPLYVRKFPNARPLSVHILPCRLAAEPL